MAQVIFSKALIVFFVMSIGGVFIGVGVCMYFFHQSRMQARRIVPTPQPVARPLDHKKLWVNDISRISRASNNHSQRTSSQAEPIVDEEMNTFSNGFNERLVPLAESDAFSQVTDISSLDEPIFRPISARSLRRQVPVSISTPINETIEDSDVNTSPAPTPDSEDSAASVTTVIHNGESDREPNEDLSFAPLESESIESVVVTECQCQLESPKVVERVESELVPVEETTAALLRKDSIGEMIIAHTTDSIPDCTYPNYITEEYEYEPTSLELATSANNETCATIITSQSVPQDTLATGVYGTETEHYERDVVQLQRDEEKGVTTVNVTSVGTVPSDDAKSSTTETVRDSISPKEADSNQETSTSATNIMNDGLVNLNVGPEPTHPINPVIDVKVVSTPMSISNPPNNSPSTLNEVDI